MKVFISHQRADSTLATRISDRLRVRHGISCYLDVVDPEAGARGEDLARHVRTQLALCSQLLAVVSVATQTSWWVPWEIGVATERDYPLATYSESITQLPEYLRRWPYLRSELDVDRYAESSQVADREVRTKRVILSESAARASATDTFYKSLRAKLGQ